MSLDNVSPADSSIEAKNELDRIIDSPHFADLKLRHRLTKSTDVQRRQLLDQHFRSFAPDVNRRAYRRIASTRRGWGDQYHRAR